MKKSIKLFYQKSIAVLITICFVITVFFPDNSFAFTSINSVSSSFIPASLGKVTSAKFYDNSELIINIQDLHCHEQTQRNINSILDYLDKKYDIENIYLEGAYKNINTKWLSNFKNEQIGSKVLETLLANGQLSGTEYYSAVSGKNEIIAPMEDENLYKENIKLFGEIINIRPEIEQICNDLEWKINSVKKDYFSYNRKINKFQRVTEKFNNKKISANVYYGLLEKTAKNNNINLDKYPNLTAYINLLKVNNNINKNKLPSEIKQFMTLLKAEISYGEYINLLNESNNLKDITNISGKLLALNDTYKITTKLKLNNLDNFLRYVEFSKNINPIEFMTEQDILTDAVFSKLAKNKYENEVVFLTHFYPKIKDYFLADITAQNYYNFTELFDKFKKILLSYSISAENTVLKLDKYQKLLLQYHKNNLKRDSIFAKKLIKEKNNTTKLSIQNNFEALEYIKNNFNGKKIKLVVTGGFHTAGLKKTLTENKVSYIVITPKVTDNIDKAKEIYTDTIKYNANILTNTINIEPLTQESLYVSFPKILNDIFYLVQNDDNIKKLQEKDILKAVNYFIDENVKNLDGNVKISNWQITEGSVKDDKIKYTVTYIENGKEKTIENVYSSIKDKDRNINKNSFGEAVIFKDLFKSFGKKAELIYKTIIAPIAENFVFLYIPFIATVTIAPYLAAVPFAVTAIFGVIVFPLAHLIADYFQKDDNKKYENRTFKKFLVPGVLFSCIFIAFSLAFPGYSFIAFVASSIAHSIYNILILKGIINNLPLALLSHILGNKKVTKEDVDNIIETDTFPYKTLKEKLPSIFKKIKSKKNFNEEDEEIKVVKYIIEKFYENKFINNKEIPKDLKDIFSEYNYVKMYFETIYEYDVSKGNTVEQLDKEPLQITIEKLRKINVDNSYINELESLKDNINADTLPVIRFLIEDIFDEAIVLAEKKQYEKTEELLQAVMPLYKQIVTYYGTIDDLHIEQLKNIAVNNIDDDIVNIVFDFIFEVYEIDKQKITYFKNGLHRPVIKMLIEILDNLNEKDISQQKYLDKLNDKESFKNIFKYYVFDRQNTKLKKENKELSIFLFNGIIENCYEFTPEEIIKFCKKMPVDTLNAFIKTMFEFVDDEQNNFEKRQIVAKFIGKTVSNLAYIDEIETEYIDVDKLNQLYDNSAVIEEELYLDNLYDFRDRGNVNPYFSFTPLLKHVYKENKNDRNKCIVKRKLIYTEFTGETKSSNEDVQEILKQLENENILRVYNDKALEDLNLLSNYIRQGKTDEEIENKFNDICESIEKMIENFEMIDPEGEYSRDIMDLKESLNKIKKTFDINNIKHHFKTGDWEEHNLSEITSLNSLINAVHQMSAKKFIMNISLNFKDSTNIQKISSQYGSVKVEGYNLSDKNVNNDILNLFTLLLQGNDTSINNLIIHNDELFWTCRLRVHSVSIHFDFKNKQINLSFTESSNNTGNRARIYYFKNVLEELGFPAEDTGLEDFSSDVLTLRANISKDTGINDNTDFIDLAQKVIFLFRHSDELDVYLGNYYGFSRLSYRGMSRSAQQEAEKELQKKLEVKINSFVKSFLNGFMWFNYRSKSHEYFKANAPIGLFLSNDERIRFEELNAEIEKLNEELRYYNFEQLPVIPSEILKEGLITQKVIDEYINKPLEKAFAEGMVIFDKNTNKFIPNQEFGFSDGIINHIKTNESDSVKQAELLNFIDNNKFNFNTVTNIGGLILKSGYIKLSGDKFLSVKVLTEPNGIEFKYAHTELISLTESVNLKHNELNKVLSNNNYNVPKIEDISTGEKQNRKKMFDRKIVYFDTPSILAEGISPGNGKYVYGEITLDKSNIDKNKILATPYTNPEDTDVILNSKAVITTTGSKISHSSIVTNEAGIPSVNIANGIFGKNKLYVENSLGQQFVLKEGSKVLLNGETGHILILDDMDKILLDNLLYYINVKDIKGLIKFLNKNSNNKDINKLIECMFFYMSEDVILEILNNDIENNVRNKLQSLIDIKLNEIKREIEQTVINMENTDNVAVKCMLLKNIEQKIENLINKDSIGNEVLGRYEFYKLQVYEKTENFISAQLSVVNDFEVLLQNSTDIQKINILTELKKIENLIPYFKTADKQFVDLKKLEEKVFNLKTQIYYSINEKKQTEIKNSNEKIEIEDFIKYGAKFLNTAITARLVTEQNIQNVKVPKAYGISEDILKLLFDKDTVMLYENLNKEFDNAIAENDIQRAQQKANEIVKLINKNTDNKDILKSKIEQHFDDKTIYAVRSSGIGEDEGNSFAGMGKTNLNVTKENIVDSVIDSWKSFYLNNPVKYMVNNKKITKRIQPCIMVQPFVTGEKSGVVFSRNRNGNSNISVGYGLGEGIVSSSVPADEIEVNINNGQVINYNRVNKNLQMLPKKDKNGTEIKPVEDEMKAKSRALNNKEIEIIMGIVKELENEYGYPIDVEWTIKDNTIYILQVRPITILNENEGNNQKQKDESYDYEDKNYKPVASIFDNLFSNKTTNSYKLWTFGVAPVIETLFIAIPFILFGINPLVLAAVSVIGFAISHRFADEIINKFIDSSAEVRSLSDIIKIAGSGIIFSSVFLAINMLLPGYSVIAFAVTSIAHSIYNYISTKTDKIPAATIINYDDDYIPYDLTNEPKFDIEQIYERDVEKEGVEKFLNRIEVWKKEIDDKASGLDNGFRVKVANLVVRLYIEQKSSDFNEKQQKQKREDAQNILYMAYKTGLIKDMDLNFRRIRAAGYDGAKFFYNGIAKHYPDNDENKKQREDLRKTLKQVTVEFIKAFKNIDKKKTDEQLYKTIKKIKTNLEDFNKDNNNVNEININVVFDELHYLPSKINNGIDNGNISVKDTIDLIDAIIPVYNVAIKQKIKFNDKIFEFFKKFALESYSAKDNRYINDNAENKKIPFYNIVELLMNGVQNTEVIFNRSDEYIVEIAKNVYNGHSPYGKEDNKRKKDAIKVLEKFQAVAPKYYMASANEIFNDIVLNEDTLKLLFKSLKETEQYEYRLELNTNNVSDEIKNLIVDNCAHLDIGYMCHYFYFKSEKGKGYSSFTEDIIKKITKRYNSSTDEELKKSAAVALGEIYSVMYEYIDIDDIVSIDELNNFYTQNNMNYILIKNYSYVENLYDWNAFYYYQDYSYDKAKTEQNYDIKISEIRFVDAAKLKYDYEFNITPLVSGNVRNEEFKLKQKAPTFVKTYNFKSVKEKEQEKLAEMFDIVKLLLEHNSKALQALDEGNFNVAIEYLKKMIDCMSKINEDDAKNCGKSLGKIEKDIKEGKIEKENLNSLINVVHQTAMEDFKINIKNIDKNSDSNNLIKSEHKGTVIKADNLSTNENINPEIYQLMKYLSLDKHNVDLIFKDDMVVWSKILLAHSVDIIFNFGTEGRGINIYYNEGGDDLSNEWRINYFMKVLKNLGFDDIKNNEDDDLHVEDGIYGIRVSLGDNSGINDQIDLPKLAAEVIKLFEYSINMDIKLERVYSPLSSPYDFPNEYESEDKKKERVEGQIDGYADVFLKGDMPFNYNYRVSKIVSEIPSYMERPRMDRIKEFKNYLNNILKNLGLEQIPEDVLNGEMVYVPNGNASKNFFMKDIDEYFNKPIEQAFIEGRIIFDSEGKLIKNKNYNLIDNFMNIFNIQGYDCLISAEIINDIPHEMKYYGTRVRGGRIKLLNGDYLYIKEIFNKNTYQTEYAQAELVTSSGRKTLTGEELKKILEQEGYKVKDIKNINKIKINKYNLNKIIKIENELNLINGQTACEGKEEYKVLKISFDTENIDENTVLFKEFTTPNDFNAIEKSGGVLTTSGGMLSHAAITTRELGKPSLRLNNCKWKQDENGKYVEFINYSPTDESIIKIRQNDKILMSAKNGFIVKLSEADNLNDKKEKLEEYTKYLREENKEYWQNEIIGQIRIISKAASGQIAEILFFNLFDNITKSGYETDELDSDFLNKLEEEKNNIFDNIIEFSQQQDNKEEFVSEEKEQFGKDKDIVNLDNIKANQKNRFGGKTVELAKVKTELKDYDVTVPNGLGLSKNVADEYCGEKYKKLNDELKDLIIKNKKDMQNNNEEEIKKNKKEIDKIIKEIRNIIENSSNEEIENRILEYIDKDKYYAVRSSGIGEDGREYAFAGMGESVLNVKGSDVIKEIKNVWKSFYNEQAIEYMLNTGQFIQPAVLVQEMVDPAYAGVAFSRNEQGYLLINVAEGLGDKVVDGTVNPDEIEVNPITGEKKYPDIETILTPEQIKKLNEIIGILEENAGYPIDTEFAFDKKGKLNILQRRADTKFNDVGKDQQADIKFDKIENGNELFCVEYNNKAIPVIVEFDEKSNQITFVAGDDNFNDEDKNIILRKIEDRVNNDTVVRTKVNKYISIFNNIAPGKLEILPPVPVDNLEIDRNKYIDDFKNSRNTINILAAA